MDPKLSPHVLQNKLAAYAEEPFSENNRILSDDYPSENYKPSSKNQDLTVVHYGRRQLLLNEIEFLTISLECLKEKFGEENLKTKRILVVYAGAAIGYHILILPQFFPFIQKFIVCDWNEFDFKYGNKNLKRKVEIYNDYLDVKYADTIRKTYSDEENWIRLFISDIRRTNDSEEMIEEDTNLQADLHRALQPFKSYLKFRLPYAFPDHKTLVKKYLKGTIYFILYGNRATTETRLLVDRDAEDVEYDCVKYENQLYYFNKNDRTKCYKHDVKANGIDHCYDCRTEVYILNKYLDSYDLIQSLSQEKEMMPRKTCTEFVELINQLIDSDNSGIEYLFNSKDIMYKGLYNFTRMKYGIKIDDEFLMDNFGRNNNHYNSRRDANELANKFNKLNINRKKY